MDDRRVLERTHEDLANDVAVIDKEPQFHALYELESPDVLVSPAWGQAVDQGRWPGEVRPYTKNRRHVLFERIS